MSNFIFKITGAKELVDRFWELDMRKLLDDNGDLYWMGKENAKQCALICVDEIVKTYNENDGLLVLECLEVKQEIKEI